MPQGQTGRRLEQVRMESRPKSRKRKDKIAFKVVVYNNDPDCLNETVHIFVNGTDLLELLAAEDRADGDHVFEHGPHYQGLQKSELWQLDEDRHPMRMPDWQYLYACGICGTEVCEAVFVEMLIESDVVRWTRFHRRRAKKPFYTAVGPFEFDSFQYGKALSEAYFKDKPPKRRAPRKKKPAVNQPYADPTSPLAGDKPGI